MEPQKRKFQITIWYVAIAVAGVLLFQQFWSAYTEIATIPYSQFEQLLNDGKIAEVSVSADTVRGTVKEPLLRRQEIVHYGTRRCATGGKACQP